MDIAGALETLREAGYQVCITPPPATTQGRPNEFLSGDELKVLTGKARSAAQEPALARLGLPYRPGPDSRLLVSRHHVREWLEGKRPQAVRGIDFSKVK